MFSSHATGMRTKLRQALKGLGRWWTNLFLAPGPSGRFVVRTDKGKASLLNVQRIEWKQIKGEWFLEVWTPWAIAGVFRAENVIEARQYHPRDIAEFDVIGAV